MASPQLEDGYVRWANELLEQVYRRDDFTARELRVILYVGRYTYGFNRKTMPYSPAAMAKELGWRREHAGRLCRYLAGRHVLVFSADPRPTAASGAARGLGWNGLPPQEIGIQKDFDTWLRFPDPRPTAAPEAEDGLDPRPNSTRPEANGGIHTKTVVKTERQLPPSTPLKGGEKAPSRSKGTSLLPNPFAITDGMRDWFREKYGSRFPSKVALNEHEKFCNYWWSNRKLKADWLATWRTWMLNAPNKSKDFLKAVEAAQARQSTTGSGGRTIRDVSDEQNNPK